MDQGWVVFLFRYLIPMLQISVGILMLLHPPAFQNGAYGFYSARSAASRERWKFAQRSFAGKSLGLGFPLLALGWAVGQVFPNGATAANLAGLALGCASLLLSCLWVEGELRSLERKDEGHHS